MESSKAEVVECRATYRVEPGHVASHLAEKGRRVLSTPCLVLYMEATARRCLDGLLPVGRTSVGYRVDVKHRRPVPEGGVVEVVARLVEFDDRRALFYIRALSGGELVGEAFHERFVVEG